jgi:hypothetical protein
MEANLPLEQRGQLSGFAGRTVLSFESRRATEIAKLIDNYGGRPMVAPATREIPAEKSPDIPRFAAALLEGKLDLVIFLTGVGTRALARALEQDLGSRPRTQTRCRLEGVRRSHHLDSAGAEYMEGNSSTARCEQSAARKPRRRGAGTRDSQSSSDRGFALARRGSAYGPRLRLGFA